MKLQLNQWNI